MIMEIYLSAYNDIIDASVEDDLQKFLLQTDIKIIKFDTFVCLLDILIFESLPLSNLEECFKNRF